MIDLPNLSMLSFPTAPLKIFAQRLMESGTPLKALPIAGARKFSVIGNAMTRAERNGIQKLRAQTKIVSAGRKYGAFRS